MIKLEKEIVLIDIDKIIPYERNNKKHPKEQIDKLAKQIKTMGWDVPIVVDENNIILKGHGRLEAARQLKIKKVPCIIRTGLTEDQKKAVRIADNRISDLGEIDFVNLRLEMEELKNIDFDLELTGFDDWNIQDIQDNNENNISEKDTERDENKSEEVKENNYTKKIKSPIYEPKRENKPSLNELYDSSKAQKLIKEIQESNLPEDEKVFLSLAAYRHIVFNYENIAEYYAHSQKEAQNLIENSALVIIDFNKAIENGFVVLTEELADAYKQNLEIIKGANEDE